MNALPNPLLGWPLLPLPDEQGQLTWPTLEAPRTTRTADSRP
jgi:hypothetical protein